MQIQKLNLFNIECRHFILFIVEKKTKSVANSKIKCKIFYISVSNIYYLIIYINYIYDL